MDKLNLSRVYQIYCRGIDGAVSLFARVGDYPQAVNVDVLSQSSDDRRLLQNEDDVYIFVSQMLCVAEDLEMSTLIAPRAHRQWVEQKFAKLGISTTGLLPSELRLPRRFEFIIAVIQYLTGKDFGRYKAGADGDVLFIGE